MYEGHFRASKCGLDGGRLLKDRMESISPFSEVTHKVISDVFLYTPASIA